MTPANLLVLVSGPNCQRQSRQRFLESVTVRPGSPRPHFTTAKLAMPWLQAGPQAQVPQCKCREECFYQGITPLHPMPCRTPICSQPAVPPRPSFSQAVASSTDPESLLSHPLFLSTVSGSQTTSPRYTLISGTLLHVRLEQTLF